MRLDDSGKPGAYAKQLLDLRFFQRKSLDYIADQLGLSGTTHYRHEQEALGMLERAIIELVVPAVRLSIPTQPARFVGRTQLIESCLAELKQLRTINLVGPPGIGKSSLAAVLASRWGREQVFWYSLQPGFNNQLMSLMHALGYFLFRLGHPALWLQLIASRGNSDAEVCAAIVRHELSDLHRKPLVCIDNADVLLPFEDKQHTQLLSFWVRYMRSRQY